MFFQQLPARRFVTDYSPDVRIEHMGDIWRGILVVGYRSLFFRFPDADDVSSPLCFPPSTGGGLRCFFLVSSEKQIGRRLLSQDALVTAGRPASRLWPGPPR